MTDRPTPSASDASTRYAMAGRIATGGMGEVWRARDTVLERDVAVKVLKPEYADDPSFRDRFQAEARHAAALHHPNVAAVFDFGELPAEDGSGVPRPYLVMELVPGEPLSALLRGGEPMPPETAAELVAQAADAVAAAHALDIVHRDIKPANLLVTPSGTVKITDFGIARAADAASLTATGQIIGTPQYLSPEQAEGKPATRASDIYALGVVLYECLAGRRPFQADTPVATALQHLRDEPPPLPDTVPEHLRAVTAAALAKDPAVRLGSAAELASALRGGPVDVPAMAGARVDDAPTVVDPGVPGAAAAGAAAAVAAEQAHEDDGGTRVLPAPGSRTTPPVRRRALPPWLPWVGAAVAVLLVVGTFALLAGGSPDGAAAGTGAGTAPTSSPSSSPSASPSQADTVTVRKSDYVGRKKDEATKALKQQGLTVTDTTVANPGGHPKDTVADLSPTGALQPGTPVTLMVWGPEPAPAPAPKPDKHGHDHGKGKGKNK